MVKTDGCLLILIFHFIVPIYVNFFSAISFVWFSMISSSLSIFTYFFIFFRISMFYLFFFVLFFCLSYILSFLVSQMFLFVLLFFALPQSLSRVLWFFVFSLIYFFLFFFCCYCSLFSWCSYYAWDLLVSFLMLINFMILCFIYIINFVIFISLFPESNGPHYSFSSIFPDFSLWRWSSMLAQPLPASRRLTVCAYKASRLLSPFSIICFHTLQFCFFMALFVSCLF